MGSKRQTDSFWGCGKAGVWRLEGKPKATEKNTARIKRGQARSPVGCNGTWARSLGKENQRKSVGGPRRGKDPG